MYVLSHILDQDGIVKLTDGKAVTQCEVKDKASGKLLAVGEHGKSALSDQDPRL